MSSARIPLFSLALPFLSLLIAAWISWSVIKSISSPFFLRNQLWFHDSTFSEAFHQFHCLHLIYCRIRRRHLQSLLSMWLYHLCRWHIWNKHSLLRWINARYVLDTSELFKDSLYLFLSFWSFLVSGTLSYLFTHFFQVLFLSSCNMSPTSSFVTSSCSSSIFFAAVASFLCIHFLLICRIFIDSCRFIVARATDCVILVLILGRLLSIHVALGTDSVCLDLVVNRLLRIHVALGTDCDFQRWSVRAITQTNHVVCQHTMSWAFFTCHSHIVWIVHFSHHRIILSLVWVSVVVTPYLFVVASLWMCIASYPHWLLFCCCGVCICFLVMRCSLSFFRLCFFPVRDTAIHFLFFFCFSFLRPWGSSILARFVSDLILRLRLLVWSFLRVLDIFLRTWMLLCYHLFDRSVHGDFP